MSFESRVDETAYVDADNARDTEVWFIDAGPYAGKAYDAGTNAGDGDLSINSSGNWNAHHYETYLGQVPVPGSIDNLTSQ
jgi:hypothetical protein